MYVPSCLPSFINTTLLAVGLSLGMPNVAVCLQGKLLEGQKLYFPEPKLRAQKVLKTDYIKLY